MEELRDGHALPHAVVRGPVVLLPAGGGEGAGDGVPPEVEQAGEKLGAHPLMIRPRSERRGGVGKQPVEVFAQ